MKFDEVKEIINMINDSELSYFEVNIDNKYIKKIYPLNSHVLLMFEGYFLF